MKFRVFWGILISVIYCTGCGGGGSPAAPINVGDLAGNYSDKVYFPASQQNNSIGPLLGPSTIAIAQDGALAGTYTIAATGVVFNLNRKVDTQGNFTGSLTRPGEQATVTGSAIAQHDAANFTMWFTVTGNTAWNGNYEFGGAQ